MIIISYVGICDASTQTCISDRLVGNCLHSILITSTGVYLIHIKTRLVWNDRTNLVQKVCSTMHIMLLLESCRGPKVSSANKVWITSKFFNLLFLFELQVTMQRTQAYTNNTQGRFHRTVHGYYHGRFSTTKHEFSRNKPLNEKNPKQLLEKWLRDASANS